MTLIHFVRLKSTIMIINHECIVWSAYVYISPPQNFVKILSCKILNKSAREGMAMLISFIGKKTHHMHFQASLKHLKSKIWGFHMHVFNRTNSELVSWRGWPSFRLWPLQQVLKRNRMYYNNYDRSTMLEIVLPPLFIEQKMAWFVRFLVRKL